MELGLYKIVSLLDGKTPFSFSRWGDGEIGMLLELYGDDTKTCDGLHYFSDMNKRLRQIILSHPTYYMGISAKHTTGMGELTDKFYEFLSEHGLSFEWADTNVFHNASVGGLLAPFTEALMRRKDHVVLVGPDYLRSFKIYDRFVEIPAKDCWLEYGKTLEEVRSHLDGDAIVLYAASALSNVLIDDLANDPRITQIDVGSVLDPYAGRHTRSEHHNLVWLEDKQTFIHNSLL